ncbi:DEAD/DEAH box helicase [Magnetofaba australis]|uniref:Putative DEAD/DEAH box helicase n=1 Tax=Magnetofaba australis IT-1 TaxID=1434232 RepID=A0A1Y2K7S2_9PROT|nr:DEAD/DEAH box helicase [Magnetofaba australis]OSM06788.1 putative DEAD/DEAH box helicase [Magnetofaba australis IT-1]
MEFAKLPIPELVQAGIRDCGYTQCTPIQAATLPLSLAGKDVAGQAQTGTGKTAAFLIATFSRLVNEPRKLEAKAGHHSAPRVLVIAPTRELVAQIEQDAIGLNGHTQFNILAVYGGIDYDKQRDALTDGGVDVLIGTPGRLIDYFKQKAWIAKGIEVLVIDEADRMFDMGFIDDLRYMLKRMPPYQERLSMLFSATLSYRAQELSYEYMDMPEVLSTTVDVKTAERVTQALYHVMGSDKISLLAGILRQEMQHDDEEGITGSRAMIFVNTKRAGERVKRWLDFNGISTGYLSGDVPQVKRLKVLRRFQEGELAVLIATDVAGRGLHIDGVTHVINYDMPENPEDYVHRIGRTARAGAQGDAISLVDEEGAYNLEAIEKYIGMKIETAWAEDALMAELKRPPKPPRKERDERGGKRRDDKRSGGPSRGSGERSKSRRRPKKSDDASGEAAAPAQEAAQSAAGSTPQGAPQAAPDGEAPKKKRRRRRRRKPADGQAQTTNSGGQGEDQSASSPRESSNDAGSSE